MSTPGIEHSREMVKKLSGEKPSVAGMQRYPGSGTGARVLAWGINAVVSYVVFAIQYINRDTSVLALLPLLYPAISVILAVRAVHFGVYTAEGRVVIRSWFTTYEIKPGGIYSVEGIPYAGLTTNMANFLPGPYNPVRMIRIWRGTMGLNYRDYPVTVALRRKTDAMGLVIAAALGVEYEIEKKTKRRDSGKRAKRRSVRD
jgi:hypothetical protein